MTVNNISIAKQNVAKYVISMLPNEGIFALGSGSTVNEIINSIDSLTNLCFISASSSTSLKLAERELKEISLNSALKSKKYNQLICVDGADQVDLDHKIILKGHGGALVKEKILWYLADKIFVTIDYSKLTNAITSYLPIEVIPSSSELVKQNLLNELFPDSRINLRVHGTSQTPVLTDNHNYILDIFYPNPIRNGIELHNQLKLFSGVVDTGLFTGKLVDKSKILVGYQDHVSQL